MRLPGAAGLRAALLLAALCGAAALAHSETCADTAPDPGTPATLESDASFDDACPSANLDGELLGNSLRAPLPLSAGAPAVSRRDVLVPLVRRSPVSRAPPPSA
jgi:hypothetical protein